MTDRKEIEYHSGQIGMDYRNELDKEDIKKLQEQLKEAVEILEDIDFLSTHAPCMNKKHYNLENLTDIARQFLAKIKIVGE